MDHVDKMVRSNFLMVGYVAANYKMIYARDEIFLRRCRVTIFFKLRSLNLASDNIVCCTPYVTLCYGVFNGVIRHAFTKEIPKGYV